MVSTAANISLPCSPACGDSYVATDTCRLGLYAGDSCSRSKETISQTLRFLDTAGYLEPSECVTKDRASTPRMIGILAPKDERAAADLGSVLRPTKLPIGVYDRAAFHALMGSDAVNIVSSVPSIGTYLDVST